MPALTFRDLRGNEASPYVKELAALRISVFAEFPYLYKGSLDYESRYLSTYFSCPEALVVVCYDGEKIVGASTAIPLRFESEEMQKPFLDAGIDPKKVMYFGESILLPQYRGHGIGKVFFHHRLQYAARQRGIEWATFCAVMRPSDHHRRPSDYRPLDGLWQSFGFKKKEGMIGEMLWQDWDEDQQSKKTMQFWLRPIVPIRAWEGTSVNSTSL